MSYNVPSLVDQPAIRLGIGNAVFADDVVAIHTRSVRRDPLDWVDIQIDNADGQADAIEKGAGLLLALGYTTADTMPLVFAGTVDDVRRERTVTVSAVDWLGALREPRVDCWRNVTPVDVVRALLELTLGASALVTSEAELTRLGHFVCPGLTGLQALADVSRAWGLNWDLYAEPNGSVWFGPWNESPRAQTTPWQFESGTDLTAVIPAGPEGSRGKLVMHAQPEVQHSHTALLTDDSFGAEPALVRFETVEHLLGVDGPGPSYRTEAEWTRLA